MRSTHLVCREGGAALPEGAQHELAPRFDLELEAEERSLRVTQLERRECLSGRGVGGIGPLGRCVRERGGERGGVLGACCEHAAAGAEDGVGGRRRQQARRFGRRALPGVLEDPPEKNRGGDRMRRDEKREKQGPERIGSASSPRA